MRRVLASLIISAVALFGSLVVLAPMQALAATADKCTQSSAGFLGFPTWYKYLNPTFEDGECKLNIEFPQDLTGILLAVFEIILRIGGLAAVGFIIFGGFQYLISQGEPDRTKGAKSTILNALIGLAITLSATAIVNLIGRNIT
jgi:hypothetical protein